MCVDESFAQLQLPFVHEFHLPDPPARRIRLPSPQPVRGALVQAQPAMNAMRIDGVFRLVGAGKSARARRNVHRQVFVRSGSKRWKSHRRLQPSHEAAGTNDAAADRRDFSVCASESKSPRSSPQTFSALFHSAGHHGIVALPPRAGAVGKDLVGGLNHTAPGFVAAVARQQRKVDHAQPARHRGPRQRIRLGGRSRRPQAFPHARGQHAHFHNCRRRRRCQRNRYEFSLEARGATTALAPVNAAKSAPPHCSAIWRKSRSQRSRTFSFPVKLGSQSPLRFGEYAAAGGSRHDPRSRLAA